MASAAKESDKALRGAPCIIALRLSISVAANSRDLPPGNKKVRGAGRT